MKAEQLGEPALLGHRTVTSEAVATFGSLTGDYSRIHFDHELGRASLYGGGFAHGLLSASWALGAMTLYAPERLGCGDPRAYLAGFTVRFHDVVRFGDTLALRCQDAEADESPGDWKQRCSEFAFLNQAGRTATSGAVEVHLRDPKEAKEPTEPLPSAAAGQPAWPGGPYRRPPGPEVWSAEDVLELGPRGASPVRTVTEADVVNYLNFSGELNPLYLDAKFAEQALFGERTVPPMLCFCLGFSVWLRELMKLPLSGGESSAGHLGDRWRFVAPVHIGDTLEIRYQPLTLRRTRSQAGRGVATFGLQLVNQHQRVVQQGEVDMMLAMRETESAPRGDEGRQPKPGDGK
ncbi:MAG: MaoC family dehydratase N-terminal domain-containing protein [Deltaproteobacteria bacterium]|nr:MaoC family dehydratase N-terminal domain-containing protein [Deltaproteobacteria bacterium]